MKDSLKNQMKKKLELTYEENKDTFNFNLEVSIPKEKDKIEPNEMEYIKQAQHILYTVLIEIEKKKLNLLEGGVK